jgi:hypothetical protein
MPSPASGLFLALAALASLVVGRKLELVLTSGADACGAVCCCAPAAPVCCAQDAAEEDLPQLVSTCGCARPGELSVVLAAGEWILPPAPCALTEPARAPPAEPPRCALASHLPEPETPPPRSGLDRLHAPRAP